VRYRSPIARESGSEVVIASILGSSSSAVMHVVYDAHRFWSRGHAAGNDVAGGAKVCFGLKSRSEVC
jgi:hypothetical protein